MAREDLGLKRQFLKKMEASNEVYAKNKFMLCPTLWAVCRRQWREGSNWSANSFMNPTSAILQMQQPLFTSIIPSTHRLHPTSHILCIHHCLLKALPHMHRNSTLTGTLCIHHCQQVFKLVLRSDATFPKQQVVSKQMFFHSCCMTVTERNDSSWNFLVTEVWFFYLELFLLMYTLIILFCASLYTIQFYFSQLCLHVHVYPSSGKLSITMLWLSSLPIKRCTEVDYFLLSCDVLSIKPFVAWQKHFKNLKKWSHGYW